MFLFFFLFLFLFYFIFLFAPLSYSHTLTLSRSFPPFSPAQSPSYEPETLGFQFQFSHQICEGLESNIQYPRIYFSFLVVCSVKCGADFLWIGVKWGIWICRRRSVTRGSIGSWTSWRRRFSALWLFFSFWCLLLSVTRWRPPAGRPCCFLRRIRGSGRGWWRWWRRGSSRRSRLVRRRRWITCRARIPGETVSSVGRWISIGNGSVRCPRRPRCAWFLRLMGTIFLFGGRTACIRSVYTCLWWFYFKIVR